MDVLADIMVYLGSALMVYNIARCYGFMKRVRELPSIASLQAILPIPLILLISFLVGYLIVGIFGSSDLVIGGILFGGSIFVAIVMSVMYRIVDRLRESNARSDALYAQTRENLADLAKNYLSVFRVNLTNDTIEAYVGESHYEGEDVTGSYDAFMERRRKSLVTGTTRSNPEDAPFLRKHLLKAFAEGRTSVSERLFVELSGGRRSFIELQARLTTKPGTGDVIAFITEGICNVEAVNEALLSKALIEQFDMITSLSGDQYNVVIGEAAGKRGSIFPEQLEGSYQHYLDTQVAPVLCGDEDERRKVIDALQFQHVEETLRQQEPYEVNVAIELDGEVFYKRFVFYVVDPEAHFYLLLKSDTTDARREEIQRANVLAEALDKAQRANEVRSLFLSNISHDFRTPMNAVIGYIEIAKKCDSLEQMREYLDKIDSSNVYMNALLNDALEMSRLDSGNIEPNLEPMDVVAFADNLCSLYKTQMAEKGITYRVDASSVSDRHIICDRTRLNSVMMNLISNAYTYTPEQGNVDVVITQEFADDGGTNWLELRVKDTGIGMSEEFAAHAFDAFERERTTTESGIHGTGMGLALCKGIVDKIRGTIELKTKQGEGSEFTVRAPFEVDESFAAADAQELESDADQGAIDFTGMRALLVEDNEINREIAGLILEEMGFTVDMAEDGQQAVDALLGAGPGAFDVVVTDLQMPVMDGYEEARTIRALDDPQLANVPIVAMSANAFAEDIAATKAVGMNAHVAKPIDFETVREALQRVLG